jgi:hypothetical protein
MPEALSVWPSCLSTSRLRSKGRLNFINLLGNGSVKRFLKILCKIPLDYAYKVVRKKNNGQLRDDSRRSRS